MVPVFLVIFTSTGPLASKPTMAALEDVSRSTVVRYASSACHAPSIGLTPTAYSELRVVPEGAGYVTSWPTGLVVGPRNIVANALRLAANATRTVPRDHANGVCSASGAAHANRRERDEPDQRTPEDRGDDHCRGRESGSRPRVTDALGADGERPRSASSPSDLAGERGLDVFTGARVHPQILRQSGEGL